MCDSPCHPEYVCTCMCVCVCSVTRCGLPLVELGESARRRGERVHTSTRTTSNVSQSNQLQSPKYLITIMLPKIGKIPILFCKNIAILYPMCCAEHTKQAGTHSTGQYKFHTCIATRIVEKSIFHDFYKMKILSTKHDKRHHFITN